MPLQSLRLPADPSPLPSAVAEFLAAATERVNAWFDQPGTVRGVGFVPSDYELVFRVLRTLRDTVPDARRFCEWGSGFGVVTGLAVQLGFEAHGIEIDAELVASSRSLLQEHDLDATIVHGSFVPEAHAERERMTVVDGRTVLSGAEAYGDMDLALDDFDVVFAYPWPTEHEQYCSLFRRGADYGAVLVTYAATEGVRAFRKVGRRRA